MRLSIIIPALNETRTIGHLFSDLARIHPAIHEIILVDGGSRDGTMEQFGPQADQAVSAPRGRASQMNVGARAATGDLLWFLHADSRIPSESAASILSACGNGASWGRFDVRLGGPAPMLRVVERMMNLRSRLTGIATGDQGIFVTQESFEQVGGYPEIPLMEDIALSKSLRRIQGPACLPGPIITSSRRWEEGGVIRTILLMWRLRLAYALGADPGDLAERYARGRAR